jgi:hypothetical protein
MNRKLIALLVSLLTVGASASVFAAASCCPSTASAGAAAAPAATPARMMLASYEKVSNALAADNLADAQAAARTFAAVVDITGTKLGCPMSATKAAGKDCSSEKKECGSAQKDCGTEKKCCKEEGKGCTKSLQALIQAKNLEEARAQFKLISAQAIKLAEAEGGFYVMTCPMAGEGADWLQSDREVRNPYHGSSMLRCGSVKSATTGAQ